MKKHLLTGLIFLSLSFFSNSLYAQIAPGSYEPDSSGIATIGAEYALSHFSVSNYPNPVINNTIIRYNVPISSIISLNIYNTSGQPVATLFKGFRKAGSYSAAFSSDHISNGIYLCTLSYISNNKYLFTSQKMYVIKGS